MKGIKGLQFWRGEASHSQLTLRASLHIESSLNMQFRAQFFIVQLFAVALLFSSGGRASPASPADHQLIARKTEISCRTCSMWGARAGDACCSASCIAQDQGFHGGYCDSSKHVL